MTPTSWTILPYSSKNRIFLYPKGVPVLLERIPPEARKTEDEFWEAFGKAKPEILGWMLDVLSRALAISPTRPAELPRMADFAIWWHRIAEALWGFGPQFMKDYLRNEKWRNAYVLEDDIVAQSLVRFMATDSWGRRNWEWTPTELFKNLSRIAKLEWQDKYFPKSSSTFMKRLNEVRINLKDEGYGITTERGHEWRKIRIGRLDADGRPATPKEREPLPF